MSLSGVWNLIHPFQSSLQQTIKKLLPSGQEFYGTVVKHGVNPKTVTVSVNYKYWDKKYRKFFSGRKSYQVHDEDNFTVTGDKVVIKQCEKLTPTKYYYVRNVIVPYPRDPPKEYDETMKQLQRIRQELLLEQK